MAYSEALRLYLNYWIIVVQNILLAFYVLD